MPVKRNQRRKKGISFSFTILDLATLFVVINVAFYVVLWLLAWKNGAIPETGDFFGNHGPWRRDCFLSSWLGDPSLFCVFTRELLPLMIFTPPLCLLTSLAGLVSKPGWRGVSLVLASLLLGYVAFQHISLID